MIIDGILYLAAAVYPLAALSLIAFVGSFGLLLVLYWTIRHNSPQLPVVPDNELPSATVQLLVHNEMVVIGCLIDVCARLDYPAGKLCVQVIDDSTDEIIALIRRRIAYWQDRGVWQMHLLRRSDRTGYKAGVLAYGLNHLTSEYIAVFDADFIPPRDFLRCTLPYFTAKPNLALIQSRWNHPNETHNGRTRAQALTIDGHFIMERTARNHGKLPMSMKGMGGLRHVAALRDAGGSSSGTITEDLDLSSWARNPVCGSGHDRGAVGTPR